MTARTIRDLDSFQDAIRQPRVMLFKHSPTCPISTAAYAELGMFEVEHPDAAVVVINVLSEPVLAREIAGQCGVEHESPQAILFEAGKATWHASHAAITKASLEAAFAPRC